MMTRRNFRTCCSCNLFPLHEGIATIVVVKEGIGEEQSVKPKKVKLKINAQVFSFTKYFYIIDVISLVSFKSSKVQVFEISKKQPEKHPKKIIFSLIFMTISEIIGLYF